MMTNLLRVIFLAIFGLSSANGHARLSYPLKSLEKISLSGTSQWIFITAQQKHLPVLLVIHGGPGFAMLPLLNTTVPELEKYFTVVNWDQRIAGKSYSEKTPLESLTLAQLVQDTHELTLLLKKRFKTNKIYLMGHSFGTIIGLLTVDQYPKDYYAYIGVGQVVSFALNEKGSYKFAFEAASKSNNQVALDELKEIGEPDAEGFYQADKSFDVTTKWVEYFGGSLYNQNTSDPINDLIFNSPIYKDDAGNIIKGYQFSEYVFNDKTVYKFNLKKISKSIVIPTYFLMGKYDGETPYKLLKHCFPKLPLKNKKLITFYKSAHFPFYEEPDKFIKVMKNIKQETHE